MDEIGNCIMIFEHLRGELFREIEYNDRVDGGNKSAPSLFRKPWHIMSHVSPLCASALGLMKCKDGKDVPYKIKQVERTMFNTIREIRKLFTRRVETEEEARSFIVELYGRVCYACKKLRTIREEVRE